MEKQPNGEINPLRNLRSCLVFLCLLIGKYEHHIQLKCIFKMTQKCNKGKLFLYTTVWWTQSLLHCFSLALLHKCCRRSCCSIVYVEMSVCMYLVPCPVVFEGCWPHIREEEASDTCLAPRVKSGIWGFCCTRSCSFRTLVFNMISCLIASNLHDIFGTTCMSYVFQSFGVLFHIVYIRRG